MNLSDSALRALSTRLAALSLLTLSLGAAAAGPPVFNPTPPPQTGNPVYIQDPNLNNLISSVSTYGTFIDGILQRFCNPFPNCIPPTSGPYTPTTAILTAANYPRVISSDSNPTVYAVVQFPTPVSQILVLPSIDHLGFSWDAYQYDIWGGTLDVINNTINFDLLFDPISVNEPN